MKSLEKIRVRDGVVAEELQVSHWHFGDELSGFLKQGILKERSACVGTLDRLVEHELEGTASMYAGG